ncbi:hypothetical protein FS837_004325 [Tulasnella sp. UAMH 9824]|nr:hypothetical protein FS837_004325 [Tulasnella sp. UAMH 9824]
MQERTPVIGLHETRLRLLTGLQRESQRNPQLGAVSVLSNSSDTPLRCFQDLDNNVGFAEQSLKEAYISLIQYIAVAKRRRNALLPIFKLPTKILGGILEMTLDLDLGQEYFEHKRPSHVEYLLTLATVSSQFFSVVMGTGTLWAVVDSRCSPSQVKRCIERSGGASIIVRYNSQRRYWRERTMAPTWWVDSLISEHVTRWRDAELAVDSEEELENLSELAVSQLERIALYYGYVPHQKPVHLFGGNAPKLRIIDLHGIHIHWEWDLSTIENLRSLVLRYVKISKASVGSFLSAIRSSLMLQKLIIRDIRLDRAIEVIPMSPSWLYNLKEIKIREVDPAVSRYFFEAIRAPNVEIAAVDCPRKGNTEVLGQLLRCLDNSIVHHVEQSQHIELQISDRATRVSLFTDLGPPVVLDLDGHHVNPNPVGWVLENIVTHRKRSTLGVRLPSRASYNLPNIFPFLLGLKDVTKLELESDGCGSAIEPTLLSCPLSRASGEQWLWPRLTDVTVSGTEWESAGQDILAIVKGRLEGSLMVRGAENEGEDLSRPMPIQTVRMERVYWLSNKAIGEHLKGLVPDIQLPQEDLSETAYDSIKSYGTL